MLQPPPMAAMHPETRTLHEGIDARIRATGTPDTSPDGPTITTDLLGSSTMVAWQEEKASGSMTDARCWAEQPSVYGRYATDAGVALVERLKELYAARAAIAVDCGAQAVALVVDVLLEPGSHAVLGRQVYGKSRIHLEWLAQRIGATVTVVDHVDAATLEREVRPETRLVLAETYSNPLTRALDPDAVSDVVVALRAGRAPGLRLVVDDTIATPWGPRRPLLDRPGLDVVVGAGTKAIAGRDRDLLGYVATNDVALANAVSDLVAARGGVLSWRAAEAIVDGLAVAGAWHARRCAAATAVAGFLASRPEVETVFHPSRPEHPDAAVIARAWARPGSLLAFRVRDLDEPGTAHLCDVIATTRVWRYALSFDGLASRVNHHVSVSEHFTPPPRLRRQGIDRLVRLGCGLEHPDDLVATLRWALDHHAAISRDEVGAWQAERAADLGIPWPHARPVSRGERRSA